MNVEIEWLYLVDDAGERRQEGPVSTEALAELASAEKIAGDTLVWQEGMAEWLPICEVADFSRLFHQEVPPPAVDEETDVTPDIEAPEEAPGAAEPPDLVTLRDFDNHSVQFSRSRKTLLVVTNDYHAGPLELTRLDLLNFLTAMETAEGRG